MLLGTGNFSMSAKIGAIGALLVAAVVPALSEGQPEPRTVERSAKAQSGKSVRIGVYLNVKPDCTSGPLPTIRLVTAPTNGTVAVRRVQMSGTNYKKCLALQVPAFVAIYRSRANFSGIDEVDLEVRQESGRIQIHKFKIEVTGSPATQPI